MQGLGIYPPTHTHQLGLLLGVSCPQHSSPAYSQGREPQVPALDPVGMWAGRRCAAIVLILVQKGKIMGFGAPQT